MGDDSKIEWTDYTWNPVRGCSRVSAGCEHCYAEGTAHRYSGVGGAYEGLTVLGPKGPRWNGNIMLVRDKLDEPIRKRRPRLVFANSMSDLFHPKVPFEYIAACLGTVTVAQQHTFQVLTKRPERVRMFLDWYEGASGCNAWAAGFIDFLIDELKKGGVWDEKTQCAKKIRAAQQNPPDYQLPNLWLGTSVEDQESANKRLSHILDGGSIASVIWASYEPALGPVDFSPWMYVIPGHPPRPALDWIVVGGESNPHGKARPFALDWARDVIKQASRYRADIRPRIFVKQLGAHPIDGADVYATVHPKGGDIEEWPEDIRVREWPWTFAGRAA